MKRAVLCCTTLTVLAWSHALPGIAAPQAPMPAIDNATFAITDNEIALSLESVLIHALKNNLDITFAATQPQAAATDITREKGAFDTLFSTQFTKYWERQQVGSALTGSNASADIYQEQTNLDMGLSKKFTPGTMAELKMLHRETQTDMPFQGLMPEYYGELMLSLTQPLLRDFGISVGTSKIRIASLNRDVSELDFHKTVMDILVAIESHYWALYDRREDLLAKQKSLQRARDLQREFKIRIEAGTLAPIEIYQADAEVALRTQNVIVAESAVKKAQDDLKAALNLYDDERYWNVAIRPLDEPRQDRIQPDLIRSVQTALQKRPDFQAAKLGLQASNIQVKYSKNQTLPRVDLIGSIATTGLSGRPRDTSGVFGPFYRSDPSPWDGHWDGVWDGLGDDEYYNYTIGIKIEIPLENRLAKSQYARARVQKSQSLINLKNKENTIINEVRDAIRKVTDSQKVLDAAMATLKLAREKLTAEERKFSVGMSTTFDLLQMQEDLAEAESSLANARAVHAQSIANFARVKGVLLEEKGLTL